MSWKSLCTKWLPLLEAKDKEIKQLRKEKEWLLNKCVPYREKVLNKMQQAPKETK